MSDPKHMDCKKIEGTLVLKKKNNLELNDFYAFVLPSHEIGKGVSLQLISRDNGDADAENGGKIGKPAHLGERIYEKNNTSGEFEFKVTFDCEKEIGVPGAFTIKNDHHTEFYLKTLTLENVPGKGRIHFVCNSWVYPFELSKKSRVFFTNESYIPRDTPKLLVKYREEELQELRGNGEGLLQEWDRVYDYAYYNDLGDPEKGPGFDRPVLGGSENPYPRRGRTGRPFTKNDPDSETRLPLLMSLNIYVPRDERFSHLKMKDFLGYALTSATQLIKPVLKALSKSTPTEFDSFEDMQKIYEQGIKIHNKHLLEIIGKIIPSWLLKEIFRTEVDQLFKFPMPQVIEEDRSAWRTDEEFAREMLAGINPVVISRLKKFPPRSELDGNQNSSMCEEDIKNKLDGLTIDEAIKKNKLFILDHHDALMPYLSRINEETSTKTYASRTLLFLKDDGTLKPLAIELSLPKLDKEGKIEGANSKVYTPAEGTDDEVKKSIWELAKAYVGVNDSGYHQLISHWLNTHAVIEPFVIAANRQLSVLHPIYKLLHPHFRDTMNINAFARQILINAGGVLELTVFPAKYSMEMSSMIYKRWDFTKQALPEDLKNRGMTDAQGHLLIEDYPYAVDGLEIWSAIEEWVDKYCSFYYNSNEMVQKDDELQSWWKELRQKGHGDLKDKSWWHEMKTLDELKKTCTTIIWLASAFHAAVNFGQYSYSGYLPNRPTISRRFMPEEGTPEYDELKLNPDKVFLETITAQLQTLLGISLIEILSRHSSDEVYLGQTDTPEWTSDVPILKAFEEFGKELEEIEKRIIKRNNDRKLKNRVGPVLMPYTLLYPTGEAGGLTAKGIPNSISI